MTLEELEARIASLNKTLLKAPTELQPPHAVSRHAAATKLGRPQLKHLVHQEPPGSSNNHGHGRDGRSERPGQPAMTAWQRLTAPKQAAAASQSSSSSDSQFCGSPRDGQDFTPHVSHHRPGVRFRQILLHTQ